MPKIINSDEKRLEICTLAYERFIEEGVAEFSLNKFIEYLNMSKGQFYYYFKSKEKLIFETSKYNQFPINNPDPKYPNAVKIVNESYSQCLYYPKLIDDLDFDYYKADEILEATLNDCSDYSSGTKFNDKYFNDIEFLSYHTIIKRTLPKKYSDVISKIIKERKNG